MCPMPEHFDSAAAFLCALRRSNSEWLPAGSWKSPWIFRGQSNADWNLVPSAWRNGIETHDIFSQINEMDLDGEVQRFMSDDRNRPLEHKKEAHVRRLIVQANFESSVAEGFLNVVNDLGLPIPGGALLDRVSYDHLGIRPSTTAPCQPVYGLAQHHGMPTQLLDWTCNPLYAAFFAAECACPDAKGQIAVWALDRRELGNSNCHVKEFNVQRSHIGFLHAQEGLFTCFQTPGCSFAVDGVWPSIEGLIREGLRQLVLPKSEAHELRRLLWVEGISRAHLMPTLDNATHALCSAWQDANRIRSSIKAS